MVPLARRDVAVAPCATPCSLPPGHRSAYCFSLGLMNTNFIAGVPDIVGARSDRVRKRTLSSVNEMIDTQTHQHIEASLSGGRDAIIARLHRLDRELDVDRVLMANFAIFGSVALSLGKQQRAWRFVAFAQMGFVLVHALVGWSPPLPFFRRLGFRTAREIAAERAALVERLAGWTSREASAEETDRQG